MFKTSLAVLFALFLCGLAGAAEKIQDDPNRFVTFVGANPFVMIADTTQHGLDLAGDQTGQCRIRFNSRPSASNNFGLIKDFGPGEIRASFGLYIENHDPFGTLAAFTPNIDQSGAGEVKGVIEIPTPVVGEWHTYTYVYHSSTIPHGGSFDVFIDGKFVDSTVGIYADKNGGLNERTYNSAGAFRIGGPDTSFDGSVDSCAIWNVAKTPHQVKKMKKGDVDVADPGLVSYWSFDGNGNDATPTDNTLLPVNGVQFN